MYIVSLIKKDGNIIELGSYHHKEYAEYIKKELEYLGFIATIRKENNEIIK